MASVEQAVAAALAAPGVGRVVLAVSGGADSMALLTATMRVAPGRVAAVATFDHGTGPPARAAAALVARASADYGVACVVGHPSAVVPAREAAWRAARWEHLRAVAGAYRARVATAHTRDDQVETVVMRILRGAGARGLAGLYADSAVLRPFVDVPRAAITLYLRARGVAWVDDPSNRSRAHFRNRVRLDLLPLLRAVQPDVDGELLAVARNAAAWRRSFEAIVDRLHPVRLGGAGERGSVAASDLAGYDPKTLSAVWLVVAARAGVVLDRRGTSRLTQFTRTGKVGGVIQLSGDIEVVRTRFWFVFR